MFFVAIGIGLIFAYINGMHDGGTIVATSITSHLLSPSKAIILAGIANFCGSLLLGTTVAHTISENILDLDSILSLSSSSVYILITASFVGSILWNIFTWIVKLPSSASHSLIGSMIGAGIFSVGVHHVMWINIFFRVILAMLLSPLLGFIFGYLAYKAELRMLRYGTQIWQKRIEFLHKISSFFLAFSYGSNDAQKVMGLIFIALLSQKSSLVAIPTWLVFASGASLAIGTMTGGYNMIKTVGMNICKINIKNSFASQIATFFVVTLANTTGLPISATQVVTSSVMGVGTATSAKKVNWSVTSRILISWIVTIPCSAIVGAAVYQFLHIMLL